MACKVNLNDHSAEVLGAIKSQCERALEMCGMVGESAAKKNCKFKHSTGALRNSVEHMVVRDTAYFGTNNEYAIYVEFGTGTHCTLGGGRPTPWHYQDAKGNWHTTTGSPAQPYLKPAAADNADTFKQIIESNLRG